MQKPTYAQNNTSNNELITKLQESNVYLDVVRQGIYNQVMELKNKIFPELIYVKPMTASFAMQIQEEYKYMGALEVNGQYLPCPSSVGDLTRPQYSYIDYEYDSPIKINDELSEIPWVEINQGNEKFYVAALPLMVNITFEDLQKQGLNNKIIQIEGVDYIIRNLILSNSFNEFAQICSYYEGEDINTLFNMIGVESITDPTFASEIVGTIGGPTVENIAIYSDEIAHSEIGWRPVLQLYNQIEESNQTLTDSLNILTLLVEYMKRSEE